MIDKNAMGYLSLVFTALSGGPYIYSVLKGRTKPHIFTHVIWGFLAAIAAAAQYAGHAGPGAWAAGLSAVFSLTTAALCFSHGEKQVTRSDWIAFGGGIATIALWYVTDNPLIASILATAIDASGYYPTFRKSYKKPDEEMILSYVISNIKHVISIFAMTTYSLTTLFYPSGIFLMNACLIVMLVWRRRIVRRGKGDQAFPL